MTRTLFLGWTALAALGGFPNWRVHAYLSGPRGSGKSGFLEIIGLLLGELAGEVINDVTEAGLRQQRNNHARPMLIDEFEVEAGLRSASNQQAVFAMSRRMSGGQGGRIARGTADHRPVSFRVSGQVFFASINQRQLEPQDSSRFIQIKLRQLPDLVPVEAVQLFERLRQLASMVSSRFRGHMLAASPRYDCTLLQLKARVREAGADTRMADTIAAVLTGIDLLLHRTAIDEARLADYEGLIRSFISRTDDNADSEGQDALEHLLHAIVPMDHGWRRSVSELVDAVLERDDAFSDPDGSRAAIERVGIFVMKEKGQIALLSSRSSPVADLFRQSKWQGGAYLSALLQLDGVMRPKSAVRLPNKSQKRAILIPLSYVRPVEVAKPSVTGCSGTV